jgi:hypothetical protein
VDYKFDQMRYKLKKEAAETVAQPRAQNITEIGRKKKRLPQRATRVLNEWFEQHLGHPYPTEREKRLLSRRCDITVEQLSRWFANKRTRSNARPRGESPRECPSLINQHSEQNYF